MPAISTVGLAPCPHENREPQEEADGEAAATNQGEHDLDAWGFGGLGGWERGRGCSFGPEATSSGNLSGPPSGKNSHRDIPGLQVLESRYSN